MDRKPKYSCDAFVRSMAKQKSALALTRVSTGSRKAIRKTPGTEMVAAARVGRAMAPCAALSAATLREKVTRRLKNFPPVSH